MTEQWFHFKNKKKKKKEKTEKKEKEERQRRNDDTKKRKKERKKKKTGKECLVETRVNTKKSNNEYKILFFVLTCVFVQGTLH